VLPWSEWWSRPASGQRRRSAWSKADREVPIVDRAHRPTDDEPRVQVDDRGEVELAGSGQQFGGVAHPALVRRGGGEVAIEHIGRDRLAVVAHRRRAIPSAHARDQALGPHEPHDPIAAHVLAGEIGVDPRAAVGPSTPCERFPDEDLQARVAPRVR